MEFIDLGSLTDIVNCYPNYQMKEKQIACVAFSLLNALAYLESHFIVHRDVRSDNILLKSSGDIKLGKLFIRRSKINPYQRILARVK